MPMQHTRSAGQAPHRVFKPHKIGGHEGTLGDWVKKYRVDHAGEEPPLSISDRARLRELEKENRELKMKADFLGKGAPRTREVA